MQNESCAIPCGDQSQMPRYYYRNDDPNQPPRATWRSHGPLRLPWLNYYVYQNTPFDLGILG
jgi:homoserine O-succinyltransferase